MQYKTIEGIDKPLSTLVYGAPYAAVVGHMEDAMHIYDMAWEAGFRTFDTAHSYGQCEAVLGAWLESRNHRHEAVILDKGCNPGQKGGSEPGETIDAKTIRTQLEQSLERLRTDHVELYILHRDDPGKPVDETIEVLNELKKEGKILKFGGSNWTYQRVLEAQSYADQHGLEGFSAVSPAFSMARYIEDPWGGSVALSGADQADYRNWLASNKLPVFAYSSLARGYLSGRFQPDGDQPIEACLYSAPIIEYDSPDNRDRLRRAKILGDELGYTIPQIALAWLMHQPQNVFPLVTPSTLPHMLDNTHALDIRLTPAQCRWLEYGEE